MATPRRGIRKTEKPLSSPKVSSLSKRYHNSPDLNRRINARYSDLSDSDDVDGAESFDETDRCTSRYSEEGAFGSSTLLDETPSSEHTHLSTRSHCNSRLLPRSKNTTPEESKVPKKRLYPNLNRLEDAQLMRRHHNGPTPAILIAVVLFTMCMILCVWQLYERYSYVNPAQPAVLSFEEIYKDMKTSLKVLSTKTNQSKEFWIQILSQLKLLKEDDPRQPAVILGLVPHDSQLTAVCLSQLLISLVSEAFGDAKYIAFDTVSSSHGTPAALKHELDSTLQGLNKSHAAVVYNLEKLAPDAAMIFHGYCDTENAPFKRALILLTVEIDKPYSPLLSESPEMIAHHRLMTLWDTDLREDDAAAIVSRIGSAPVVFRPEKTSVIQRICPY